MALDPGTPLADERLVFYFKDVRMTFSETLQNSLEILYQVCLPPEALVLVKEHYVGTKKLDVCSRIHHTAHESQSVFAVSCRKHLVSEAAQASRTATIVQGGGEHQGHDLVQGRTHLQLMQVAQLTERSFLDKAVLSHYYRQNLKRRSGFRL